MRFSYHLIDTERTESVQQFLVEVFTSESKAVVDIVFANPLLSQWAAAGSLACDETGRVVCTCVEMPRSAWLGGRQISYGVPMLFAARRDMSHEMIPEVLRRLETIPGQALMIANTACRTATRRFESVLQTRPGPDSAMGIRYRHLRHPRGFILSKFHSLAYRLGVYSEAFELPDEEESVTIGAERAVIRLVTLDDVQIDEFWNRYRVANSGLVSSRTIAELRWIFGPGLASGDILFFALFERAGLSGYVFLRRSDVRSLLWQVVDIIALENAEQRLDELLQAAAAYLVRKTPATTMSIRCYPPNASRIMERFFPDLHRDGWNRCFWKVYDPQVSAECGDLATLKRGWFGGPYDGDACFA